MTTSNTSTYVQEKLLSRKINPLYHRTFFLALSLSIAILLMLILFSYTTNHSTKYLPQPDVVYEDPIAVLETPRSSFKKKTAVIETPVEVIKKLEVFEVVTVEDKLELIDMEVKASDEDPIVEAVVADTIIKSAPPALPEPQEIEEDDLPYKIVEQMPMFPGCESSYNTQEERQECSKKKLMAYIYDKVKYPSIARENGIEGICVVQFVVDKQGNITNIDLVKDIGAQCGKEALDAVTSMNSMQEKWVPGKQQGRAVKVLYTLPVVFKLN